MEPNNIASETKNNKKPNKRADLNFLVYLPKKDSCTISLHQASMDSHIK